MSIRQTSIYQNLNIMSVCEALLIVHQLCLEELPDLFVLRLAT